MAVALKVRLKKGGFQGGRGNQGVKPLYGRLLDFLYQTVDCPVCGNQSQGLCQVCRKDILVYGPHVFHGMAGSSMFFYKGAAERLIYKFKKDLKFAAFDALAALMAEYWADQLQAGEAADFGAASLQGIDYLLYIPSGKKNLRQRGFDPGRLLAKEFSEISGIPLLECTANHGKGENKTLNYFQRQERSSKNIVIKNGYEEILKAKHILIFDDIMTTGASIQSLADKLNQSGAGSVKFLTVMRSTK